MRTVLSLSRVEILVQTGRGEAVGLASLSGHLHEALAELRRRAGLLLQRLAEVLRVLLRLL